MTLGISAP